MAVTNINVCQLQQRRLLQPQQLPQQQLQQLLACPIRIGTEQVGVHGGPGATAVPLAVVAGVLQHDHVKLGLENKI